MTFLKANGLSHFHLLLPWDSACRLSGPQVSRPLPEPPATTQPCVPDIHACSAVSGTAHPPCGSEQPGSFHLVEGSIRAWRRPGLRPCDALRDETLRLLKHVLRKTRAEAAGFASSGGRLNLLPCSVTSRAWPAVARLPRLGGWAPAAHGATPTQLPLLSATALLGASQARGTLPTGLSPPRCLEIESRV